MTPSASECGLKRRDLHSSPTRVRAVGARDECSASSQLIDAFFPVSSVEFDDLERCWVDALETVDVHVDGLRVRPWPIERVDPAVLAEVMLCGAGTERISGEALQAVQQLELLLGHDQVEETLLRADAAVATNRLAFCHRCAEPNGTAMTSAFHRFSGPTAHATDCKRPDPGWRSARTRQRPPPCVSPGGRPRRVIRRQAGYGRCPTMIFPALIPNQNLHPHERADSHRTSTNFRSNQPIFSRRRFRFEPLLSTQLVVVSKQRLRLLPP